MRLATPISAFFRMYAGCAGVCSWLAAPLLWAQTNLPDPARITAKIFHEAELHYHRQPHQAEAQWQFARACFDLAEFATNNTQRAELADRGILVCRELTGREPNLAAGHYYLGMNLGQLARTKGIGALKLVTQMEREFNLASQSDPLFDYAGPDRNLGLLYRDAPSIGSIGSRTRAKQHLERAVELAPNYPENHLNLLEAFLKWNDRNGAKRELKALEAMWPQAQKSFTGEQWAASWQDWSDRMLKIKKKMEEPPKAIESPRQKD